MEIYNYHPVTKEYLPPIDGKPVLADPDPLRPGEFLIPAFATEKPLPAAKKGFTRCFINGAWTQVEDHRGTAVYVIDDASGATTIIDFLGPIASGYTTAEPSAVAQRIFLSSAMTALSVSDITVLRCYENGVAVPAEWASYRGALRDIISGRSTVTELPTKPAYPEET